MLNVAAIAGGFAALALAATAGAADTLVIQDTVALHQGRVEFYWDGDTATTAVYVFRRSDSALGRFVDVGQLDNQPTIHVNKGVILGQPVGAEVYRLCETPDQTVCSQAVTVNVL